MAGNCIFVYKLFFNGREPLLQVCEPVRDYQ